MADLISVIVTTYNREDALNTVLRSLSRQRDRDFEIIVADDGSGPATNDLIEGWTPKIGVPLQHVWHEDQGFRAARIRNLAILKSSGRYCIFLDGDCIARADFVAAHRALAEPGWFVTGNRVLLSKELTLKTLREGLEPDLWTLAEWFGHRRSGGVNRIAPLLPLPLGPLRKLNATAWLGARSANLAVWRDDLDRMDGFDATYDGWGREDSDLLARLIRAGVRRKLGIFATGVVHLWHPEADRSRLPQNDVLLNDVLGSGQTRARSGLSIVGTAR